MLVHNGVVSPVNSHRKAAALCIPNNAFVLLAFKYVLPAIDSVITVFFYLIIYLSPFLFSC